MLPFRHTNHSHYKSNCPIVISKKMSQWWLSDRGVTQRTTWVNTQPLRLDWRDYLRLPSEEGSVLPPSILVRFSIYCSSRMVLVFENHITHSSEADPSQILRVSIIHNTYDRDWKNYSIDWLEEGTGNKWIDCFSHFCNQNCQIVFFFCFVSLSDLNQCLKRSE